MLSQSQIKHLKSLHQKKYREKEGKIILEGHRLIHQALTYEADIIKVWITNDYAATISGKELIQILEEKTILIETTSDKSIQRVCESQNSQGVIAVMSMPRYERILDMPKRSLYFDNIADPGNMGALLRTAVWFGINSVFLSPGCVDPLNSKVLRSALGAHFHLQNIMTIPPHELFGEYMNTDYAILGSDISGESLQNLQIDLDKGWILILGNEAHGICDALRSYITHNISIPGYNNMESLNVAVAGGILLHSLTLAVTN